MQVEEADRIAEIDRAERIRTGYIYERGRLQKIKVNWDTPSFLVDGEGEHTVAHQIKFCRDHLERNGRMFGAFDDELLVGLGIVQHEIREGTAQLAYLHVSSGYRRRGIGSQITKELIREAKRAGAERLYVSATPSGSAVGFYHSHGFKSVDAPIPELFELEPDDIHMIREI
jgi:ribosomal protein S18 acetylase RimI-like enzyme